MKKELTTEQAAYINWCKHPPSFYCRKHTNAEQPPENSKGWYCTKQCFDCMATVGETRLKNKLRK